MCKKRALTLIELLSKLRNRVLSSLLAAGLLFFPVPSSAAPKLPPDLNLVQLFQFFETSFKRGQVPYLMFKKEVSLRSSSAISLGPSCSLRALERSCRIPSTGYYNSVLHTTPGDQMSLDNRYSFSSLRLRSDSFSAVFKNENASVCTIEISCNHPDVKNWTVGRFENHSGNAIEFFSFVQKNTQTLVRPLQNEGMKLENFKGSWLNGLFGSGLPGTIGIHLLMGTDLKAFREPASAPLVIGKKCRLVSQDSASLDSTYAKDSRYAYLGYEINLAEKNVELVFGNWTYSPHQIRLRCNGTAPQVLALNSQDVERDLNGSVQFYKK